MAPPVQQPVVVVIGDVMVDVVVLPLGPSTGAAIHLPGSSFPPAGRLPTRLWRSPPPAPKSTSWPRSVTTSSAAQPPRALAATAVQAHLQVCPGQRTGVVVALIDASGERSMLTDRGANLGLGTDVLDPALFVAGRHLHLSGYVLLDEATRPVGLAALELAAAAGMTRSVDPCSAGPLAAVGADAFLSWTEGIEWCCANLDEGRALTGRQEPRRCPGWLCGLTTARRSSPSGPRERCCQGRGPSSFIAPRTTSRSPIRPAPATPSPGRSSLGA